MNRLGSYLTILLMLTLLFACESFAQRGMRWRGSGGWGMGSNYNRMYDPKSVEKISGEVVSVERMVPMTGMSYGVHIILKTDEGTLPIHLGPAWFIENQDIKISPKDRVEIKGSRITLKGKPVIIAARIKKGNEELVLRNEDGVPVWNGWRK